MTAAENKIIKHKGMPCSVLMIWIRIHRIHMFLGLLDPDPDPDPLIRGIDPDQDTAPDPSMIKQK